MRVDRRLAAGELHHLRIAFCADVVVENVLHFFQRQAESRTRLGKAKRAGHVAGAVDFDDAQAGVLLMVRAEPAIVRAAVLHFRGELHRNRAGLVELRGTRVELQRRRRPALRTGRDPGSASACRLCCRGSGHARRSRGGIPGRCCASIHKRRSRHLSWDQTSRLLRDSDCSNRDLLVSMNVTRGEYLTARSPWRRAPPALSTRSIHPHARPSDGQRPADYRSAATPMPLEGQPLLPK